MINPAEVGSSAVGSAVVGSMIMIMIGSALLGAPADPCAAADT